ncbi:hypothetical protein GH714_029245 [Hevea brasiliensis]|nr:hypothetical protein GH714_029245 [Hevea brasiliensis]
MSAPQEIPYPKDIIEKCSFIDIVGSCCNGLICLRDVYYSEHLRNVWVDSYNYDSNIVLWNPTTTETKILPQSNVPLPPDSFISLEIVDFGFDARTSDCKVLRIFEYVSLDSQWGYLVEIYSLRDDTWRKVDVNLNSWQLPSYKYDDIYYYGRGHTGANGTFHWWAREDNWKYVIVSFELSKDAIKTTALPDTINPRNSWQTTFCLNGYIALPFCDNNHVELWVLLEYGVKESWTKLFTIACPENVSQPLGFSSNGKLFLATWEGQLLVWNPTTEAIVHIRVNGVPETLQTVTYMESYIPLKIGNKFKDEQNSREANQS